MHDSYNFNLNIYQRKNNGFVTDRSISLIYFNYNLFINFVMFGRKTIMMSLNLLSYVSRIYPEHGLKYACNVITKLLMSLL
jgi:hypothetical protein